MNNEMPDLDQKVLQATDDPILRDVLGLDEQKEFENFYASLLIGPR